MQSTWTGLRLLPIVFALQAGLATGQEALTSSWSEHPVTDDQLNIPTSTPQDAISELRDLIQTSSSARDKALASLALASAHIDREPRVALQYLAQVSLASFGNKDLQRFVDYYRAVVLHRLGNFAESTKISSELLRSTSSELWEKKLYELQIEGQFQMNDHAGVITTYRKYASRFALRKREENHVRLAAEAFAKEGERSQYIDALETLAEGYPASGGSRWAFRKLLEMRCDQSKPYVFSLKFLKKISRNAVLETGLAEFLVASLTSPLLDSSGRPKSLTTEEQVVALMQMRLYPEALKVANQLLADARQARDPRTEAFALINAATIQNRMGDAKEAVRLYSEYLVKFPQSASVFRARHGLADALASAGLYREAAESYGKLAQLSKSSDYRWKHFWNHYMAGNLEVALGLLQRPGYVTSRDKDDSADLRFWKAQILSKRGQKDQSSQLVQQILSSEASSYYASVVLQNEPSLISSNVLEPSAVDAHEEQPIRTVAVKIDRGDAEGLSTGRETYELPELQLIDDLSRFGMVELAALELRGLPWSTFSKEHSFSALSRLSAVLGDYNHSSRVKQLPKSALRNVPKDWWQLVEHQRVNRREWEVYYPLAFSDVVEKHGGEFDVDKLLILSVMRAESRYNVHARSWVGARGLMQIMPYTGARIAKLLGQHNFEVDDLSDPNVNVRFSSFYLRKLLNYYQNNSVLAVAAYNAGPIAVDRWLNQCSSCEVQEFVEFIPYKETRRYVKKVMANLVQYERIYRGRKNVNFLRQLPKQLSADEDLF